MKKVNISVKIDEDDLKKLKILEAYGFNRSAIIRTALKKYMRQLFESVGGRDF